MTFFLRSIALASLAAALPAAAQRDFFELAPIKYSESIATDPMARLAAEWKKGRKMKPGGEPLVILRDVLQELGVPEESQVLVFSKTSKQNHLIRPTNPRSVFYSTDVYVGYVPGGNIEVAATDPILGPVFYLLDIGAVDTPDWVVRDNSCLQCHGTSRTELVPGVLIRSVFPDKDSHPILSAGTYLTTASSPIKERWGGWYVTGAHGDFRHMGNTVATANPDGSVSFDYEEGANLESLEGKFNTSKYLRPTSDIVSLMVLEHQCEMHNLLTKAAMEYRRLTYLQRAIDPKADLSDPEGMAARSAKDSADELVRAMLFTDEIDLGEGVEGSGEFAEAFEQIGKKSAEGWSLREMRLYGRLFRYRCSYMIYSSAFESLPPVVRTKALERLFAALHGDEEEFADIGEKERSRIVKIVKDTVPNLPACWSGK